MQKITLSNRKPDLCEYQCNGAMAAVREYKKAPLIIAEEVAGKIKENPVFFHGGSGKTGILNLKLCDAFVAEFMNDMDADARLGCEEAKEPKNDHH